MTIFDVLSDISNWNEFSFFLYNFPKIFFPFFPGNLVGMEWQEKLFLELFLKEGVRKENFFFSDCTYENYYLYQKESEFLLSSSPWEWLGAGDWIEFGSVFMSRKLTEIGSFSMIPAKMHSHLYSRWPLLYAGRCTVIYTLGGRCCAYRKWFGFCCLFWNGQVASFGSLFCSFAFFIVCFNPFSSFFFST